MEEEAALAFAAPGSAAAAPSTPLTEAAPLSVGCEGGDEEEEEE